MRHHAHVKRLRQTGAIAVEVAMGLPVLLGIWLLGSDVQRLGLERARLENTAGLTALNLASQYRLTRSGLNALVDVTFKGHAAEQDLVIMEVAPSGRVRWALRRGSGGNLCAPASTAGRYTGAVPEPSAQNGSSSGSAFIVVQSCRSTLGIAQYGGLVLPQVLRTRSVYRLLNDSIELDETLQAESDASGLASREQTS